MFSISDHIGEAASLIVALNWAIAVIMFKKSGESVHPYALNLFKCSLAFVLLIPTILIASAGIPQLSAKEFGLLLLSGALGIGISDSLFFISLNFLGAGLSAIVDCLYSPFIISLSMLWLGEKMNGMQIAGTAMIISAVVAASRVKSTPHLTRKNLILGIVCGVLAMGTMAVGIVMVKPIIERTSVFWTAEIRMTGGLLTIMLILALDPKRKNILNTLKTDTGRKFTWLGAFLGAYLSMILWIMGMKYTQASISAALNQTSNIFVFIFAALFLKERINLPKGVGIILGVTGAIIVLVFQSS